MKVFFIAHGFPPVQRSGSLRSQAFASYLPDHGLLPVVFAADHSVTNHMSTAAAMIPNWEDDARWPEVVRVTWTSNPLNSFTRIANRFPFTSTCVRNDRRKKIIKKLIGPARDLFRRHQPPVIYASHGPPECLVLGAQLASEFDVPFVADLRDPWSHAPGVPYRHWLDFWIERRQEKKTLAKATRVIVPTIVSRDILTSQCGVKSKQIEIIPNGYDETDFDLIENVRLSDKKHFEIVYAGELANPRSAAWRKALVTELLHRAGFLYHPLNIDASTRSLKHVLPAIASLIRANPDLREVVRLKVIGVSSEKEADILGDFEFPECVVFCDRVPSRIATQLCCQADLLLLLQIRYTFRNRDFCPAIPAKVYSYLRAGKRILACLQPSELSELIEEAKAGPVVSPDDSDAIAVALGREVNNWLEHRQLSRAHSFDCTKFERRQLTKQLSDLLRAVVG